MRTEAAASSSLATVAQRPHSGHELGMAAGRSAPRSESLACSCSRSERRTEGVEGKWKEVSGEDGHEATHDLERLDDLLRLLGVLLLSQLVLESLQHVQHHGVIEVLLKEQPG